MKFSKTILATAILFSLGGCGQKSSSDHMKDATSHLSQGNINSAVISYKNAIKNEPQNATLRFKLAEIYLENNEIPSAIKEYEAGINIDNSQAKNYLSYAKALYLGGEFDELLILDSYVEDIDALLIAELYYYQGVSHLLIQEPELAKQKFLDIINLGVESSYVTLAEIHIETENNKQLALEKLDSVLEKPNFPIDGHLLKANILVSLQQFSEAATSYNLYIDKFPKSYRTKLALVSTYLRYDNTQSAEKELNSILREFPDLPSANYLLSYVKLYNQNFEESFKLAGNAIDNGLNITEVKIVAGLSAFKTQKYEQAYRYLTSVESELSESHPAFEALHFTRIKLGYIQEATDTLMSNLNDGSLNSHLIDTSYSLIKSGNHKSANELISKYEMQDNPTGADLTSLATVYLALGKDDKSTAILQKALELNDDNLAAKLTLTNVKLRSKDYESALQIAESIERNNKTKIEGLNLIGLIYSIQGNSKKAAEYYEQAVKLKPDNVPSLLFKAREFIESKSYDNALEQLNLILQLSPTYVPALKLKQNIYAKQDRRNDFLKELRQINFNKQVVKYKLYYSNLLIDNDLQNEANKVLGSIEGIDKGTDFWKTLIRLHVSSNDLPKALQTINAWKANTQNNTEVLIISAHILKESGLTEDALQEVQSARSLNSNNSALQLIELELLVELGQLQKIKARLASNEKRIAEHPITLLARGYVSALEGNLIESLPNLNSSYAVLPKQLTIRLIYAVKKDIESKESAFVFLDEHLAKYPNDLKTKLLYANEVISVSPQKAATYYEQILDFAPNNIIALNNLAFLKLNLGENEEARVLIESALNIQPENIDVLDTAADIYKAIGKESESLALLKKAIKLSPNNVALKNKIKAFEQDGL